MLLPIIRKVAAAQEKSLVDAMVSDFRRNCCDVKEETPHVVVGISIAGLATR